MALETGTYVSDLVGTNPPGTDSKSQGDDHLRLIKNVLKNTFPGGSRAFRFEAVSSKATTYNVASTDDRSLILADATSGAFSINLPLGSSVFAGFIVTVRKEDASANAVTLDGNGSETINGSLTLALTEQYDFVRVMWDGTEWSVLSPVNLLKLSGGTITGDVTFADDVQAIFGAGGDLNIDSDGTRGVMRDGAGNLLLDFSAIASAVNWLRVENAATGNGPTITAMGGDTNCDLELAARGTGNVNVVVGAVREAGVPISPIGQQTIWVPASAMTSRNTSGAGSGVVETTTNRVMLVTMDFDTAADEFAQFFIQMPKGWNAGTLIFQFVWSHPATATNFGVAFAIQAVAFADDDAADTAFGTAVVTADTGGTTDDVYVSPESSAVTVAGSPAAEEWVAFQVYRDVSDASDTMAVDARLHGVKIHYTTDAATDD